MTDPLMSVEDTALLLDVDPEQLRAEAKRQAFLAGTDAFTLTIPTDWIQRGRRHCREIAAQIGTYDHAAILAHLRAKR